MRGTRISLGTCVSILLLTAPAYAAQPLGRPLDRSVTIQGATPAPASGRRVSVLVEIAPGADRGTVRELARARGGRVHYEYGLLPSVLNLRDFPESAIEALERTPGVARVHRDGVVRPHLAQGTPLVEALRSQVEGAGYTANGAGVRLCVIDTGIDSDHVMYADRIDFAAGRNFVSGGSDPEDDHGHGTHVAGIAVGGDGNTIDEGCGVEPFQGVAWEATLVGVKVINSCGLGNESDLIAGIDYCADASASGGRADVINLSVGTDAIFTGSCDGDLVASAANAAVAAGVVVVSSAGNGGSPNGLSSPACGSQVIAVGASWDEAFPSCEWPLPCWDFCLDAACLSTCSDCNPQADQVTCFSNRNAALDVVAPGCLTASADFQNPFGATWMCGTSMASPHVAGVAALLLSQNPGLTPADVRQAIRGGAVDLGAPGPDSAYGYGRVDTIASLGLVQCNADADCSDGDTCTTDTCNAGACSNVPPTCGAADGCCIEGCADPDCPTCGAVGASCTSAGDCCSGKCRGKPGSQTCR